MPSLQRCVFLATPIGAMPVRSVVLASDRWSKKGAQQRHLQPMERCRRGVPVWRQSRGRKKGASPGSIGGAVCTHHLLLKAPVQAPLQAPLEEPFASVVSSLRLQSIVGAIRGAVCSVVPGAASAMLGTLQKRQFKRCLGATPGAI